MLTFITFIYVRLCVSLYCSPHVERWCHCLVPDSSWLLSSTWCTRAHHLFGSRGGSSWWFCCWKLSHSCNRWKKLVDIQTSIWCLTIACFMYFWSLSGIHMTLLASVSHRERQREKITEKKGWQKKLWWLLRLQMHHGRSLVSLLLSTDWGQSTYYVTVLHSHHVHCAHNITFIVQFTNGLYSVSWSSISESYATFWR